MAGRCTICRRPLRSREALFCTACGTPVSIRRGPLAWIQSQRMRAQMAHASIDGWFHMEVESSKQKFAEQARVKKAQATAAAEQRLAQMHYEGQQFLDELELRALGGRGEAIVKLTDRTAKVLGAIQGSDWPPALAASCARSVLRMNERAQQSIVKREGRLGWRLSALSAQAIHFAGLFLTLKLMAAVAYLVKRPVLGVSLIVVVSFGTTLLLMHKL